MAPVAPVALADPVVPADLVVPADPVALEALEAPAGQHFPDWAARRVPGRTRPSL